MKSGMSRDGKSMTGIEYLRQRIQDAIITPKGSIPLARGYGSDFDSLIDRNVDADFIATASEMAIDMFESPLNGLKDCRFRKLIVNSMSDAVTLNIWVEFDGSYIELEGLSYGERN